MCGFSASVSSDSCLNLVMITSFLQFVDPDVMDDLESVENIAFLFLTAIEEPEKTSTVENKDR